jgi:hypothetical protein
VSVNDIKGGYEYPEVVHFEIEEQDLSSYLRAADFLNISNVVVVCLQHEFGIFGGPAGGHILALLGGVEGEVGYFRRNHLVPIPCVENLEELNRQLLVGSRADQQRRITGKPQVVGEAMQVEREHLLPMVEEGFELAETSFPRVDSKGCVKVRTNCYSTPLRPGTCPQVKLLPAYVEVWQEQ